MTPVDGRHIQASNSKKGNLDGKAGGEKNIVSKTKQEKKPARDPDRGESHNSKRRQNTKKKTRVKSK